MPPSQCYRSSKGQHRADCDSLQEQDENEDGDGTPPGFNRCVAIDVENQQLVRTPPKPLTIMAAQRWSDRVAASTEVVEKNIVRQT
jgi:hypothetical protein